MKKILLTILFIIIGLLIFQFQLLGPSVSYENVTISVNSHKLTGILAKPEGTNLPAVVVLHGLSATKEMMMPFIDGLAKAGIMVLAVDLQGHGMSSGLLMEDGNNSLQYDGVAAYNYLKNRAEVDSYRIGMLGHSMGAGTVYLTDQVVTPTANVFIGNDLADHEVNNTNPRNMLMAIGAYEELFSVAAAKSTMSRAVGTSITEDQIYGSFLDGTAHKLVVVNTDHIFEVGHSKIITESINWMTQALNVSSVSLATGWVEVMISLSSLVVALFVFVLIYNIYEYLSKQTDPEQQKSSLSVAAAVPGGITFIAMVVGSIAVGVGYQYIFMIWFLLAAAAYFVVLRRYYPSSLPTYDKTSAANGLGIFFAIFIPLQVLFFFTPWDLRYVLPLFAQISAARFLFMILLCLPATLYFFYELALLQNYKLFNYWHILLSRTWAFLLLILVQYIPVIFFHRAVLPLIFGFLVFFIVGLVPILIILSALTYVGMKLQIPALTQAIVYGAYIAWILMSTIPLIDSHSLI